MSQTIFIIELTLILSILLGWAGWAIWSRIQKAPGRSAPSLVEYGVTIETLITHEKWASAKGFDALAKALGELDLTQLREVDK